MIAVTPCERRALKKFRHYIKEHAKPLKGLPLAVRLCGASKQKKSTLGKEVSIPESDVHHLLSAPLILALSHTIEDIAMETGEGELIASFQHLDNFEIHKKRYCTISKSIDTVRVWGEGEKPKGCKEIDFVSACHPKIARYWMVLFDSPHCRAVLMCKQINRAVQFEDKRFVGFYSFNPYLVQSIRWRFNLLTSGLCKMVNHWEKSFPLPDLNVREVDAFLKKSPAHPAFFSH